MAVSGEVLKACPFCGGQAKPYCEEYCGDSRSKYPWSIRCNGAECIFDSCWYETKEDAMAAWNCRFTPWTKFDAQDRATWPEVGRQVIMCLNGRVYAVYFTLNYVDKKPRWCDGGAIYKQPQYWMPLPEPMREED